MSQTLVRKLRALEYHHPDTFNINNEGELRNLIVWLEEKCIRRCKPEELIQLKDIKSDAWVGSLKTYLAALKCPVENLSQKVCVINWLLSHAVQLRFAENTEKYNQVHLAKSKTAADKSALFSSTTTIDDPELIVGIEKLRNLLKIPHHDDKVLVLRAVAKVIEDNLSDDAINAAKQNRNTAKSEFLSLGDTALGFTTKDPALDEVAKILRLLQIHNLRDLQTQINSAIVATQKITANPKTDQSLGRVGRQ